MKITILTMFPEMFGSYLASPIPKRAIDRKIADIRILDIKEYAGGSFRHIDDDTYGGGAGAVLRARPVLAALSAALAPPSPAAAQAPPSRPSAVSRNLTPSLPFTAPDKVSSSDTAADHTPAPSQTCIAALTPVGRLYTQQTAERYSRIDHLVLLCGHYEGMDERIYSYVDERISIGDYILSGGELASQIVTDSILRLLPGILRKASTEDESFSSASSGLLEYPQYTRPADLDGDRVPEVLLSGDHEAIRIWRMKESLRATFHWRPDLLRNHHFTEEERELLDEIRREEYPLQTTREVQDRP